jgi:Zn-dependent protease with chaperone function
VSLLLLAGVLAAFSTALVGPASRWLSKARWVTRAPRCAVFLWQSIGLGATVAGIGAGLSVAVYRYRLGFVGGVRALVGGMFSGHPLQGLGLYDALGLTLAADLALILLVVLAVVVGRTVRLRARHRRLLNLVANHSASYPGTELLADSRTVAYCLPGLRPRIVLSEGTLRLLDREQIDAVIEHERGHAHEHHGLVMLPMLGLTMVLAWIPYAKLAPKAMASLLEMAADDFSVRRSRPRILATALVDMANSGWTPQCALAATGSDVSTRVARLLSPVRTSRRAAAAAALMAGAVLAVPIVATMVA